MQQQQPLNNATTTTQQCNNNYSTMQRRRNYACGTNRATNPFAKVIIRLVRLQPPSLKSYSTCQATAPFAWQCLCNGTTQMQQHQHHKFILNQPQNICTSTQSHWKDKPDINNFYVYDKIQLKAETSEKDTRKRNRQYATEQFARRTQLLVVARDGIYSLGGENIRCGELGSTRRATKNSLWRVGNYSPGDQEHSLGERWHLLARRGWALVVASDDRQVCEQTSVLTPKP